MSGVKVTVIKKRYNTGGTPATTHESQRPLKLQFGLTRAAPTDASARHARAQPLRMPRGTPRADHSRDALSTSGGVGSVGLHLVLHLLQLLLRSHLGGLGRVSGGRGRRRLGLTEQAAERA